MSPGKFWGKVWGNVQGALFEGIFQWELIFDGGTVHSNCLGG